MTIDEDGEYVPLPREDVEHIITTVRDGYMTVRRGAELLGLTMEAMQLAAWGEIRQ